jgi:hypothetical protein
MVRSVAGTFSMIEITTMRHAVWRGAVIVIRLIVRVNQAVDGGRSRDEGNRDWWCYKGSQRESGEESPDMGGDTFGQPGQHCLTVRQTTFMLTLCDYLPEDGAVK